MGDEQSMYDAVVVGTGFGGSVTALRLAEAGLTVCVLERGRRFGPDDFPDLPARGELLPDTARLMWGADQGMWDVQDLDQVLAIQVAGYGGGSLGYASVHLVPPELMFEAWPSGTQRSDLLPYYALGRHMLSLETIDAAKEAVRLPITKAGRFMDGAAGIGRRDASFHPPLAVRLTQPGDREAPPGTKVTNPISGVEQRTCVHCGACVSGCRYGAKNTLDHNYLAAFEAMPASVVITLAEVIELWPPRGPSAVGTEDDPWTVVYRDHHAGQIRRRVSSKRVFVCAGSVNTTKLLFRNRERLPALRPTVGQRYFPNADALGVVYDTKQRQNPGYGPTITSAVVARVPREDDPIRHLDGVPLRFDWDAPTPREAEGRDEHGFDGDARVDDWVMLQDGGYDLSLQPIMAMLRAPLLLARNRHDDVGKFRDVGPADEVWSRRRASARRDQASPEADYPRQSGRTYEDAFRDPVLGSLVELVRSGAYRDYLPDLLGRVLPAHLEERFRQQLELPGLERVSSDTQSIAVWRHLLQTTWLSEDDADGQRVLNRAGQRVYRTARAAVAKLGRGFGLEPRELAKAAMLRARHELGTDDIARFAIGWLRWLSNHDDAAMAPFERRPWSPDAPDTFSDRRPDAPGEFVHMLLAMGSDAAPWMLEYAAPLTKAERRRRAEELERLAKKPRWTPETLAKWVEEAGRAEGISHAPDQDTPHDTEEERERLEDEGEILARPPKAARTTHTRGTAHAMPVYAAEERLMRDLARHMGGELRLNPRWVFAGQVVTVHSQGGCGISPDDEGVCDELGRVRGYEGGLYVEDGALFPAPVGVNPSHTIVALCERNLERIRREDLGQSASQARADQWAVAEGEATRSPVDREPFTPPRPSPSPPRAASVGVRFSERLTGSFAASQHLARPVHDRRPRQGDGRLSPWFKDPYLHGDRVGRKAGHLLELSMRVAVADLATFVETGAHQAKIEGTVRIRWPAVFGDERVHEGFCRGGIRVLPEADETRPGLESMRYALHLEVDGRQFEMMGQKVIVDDPGPDLWADTTALFVRLRPLDGAGGVAAQEVPEMRGVLRLGLADFIELMVRGLEVTGTEDPARVLWATTRFLFFFGAGLQRVYAPWLRRFMERLVRNELGIR